MPTLFLARHAQASYGADDYDVLSERGHEQATALVRALEQRGARIERVITGSLRRQRDTAAPVAARWGVDVTIDRRWDEYDADDVLSHHSSSGARPHRTAGEQVPPREFQDILEAALLAWITAGEATATSESYAAFGARCAAALKDAAAGLSRGGALVCTSGGVLGAVCAELLNASKESFLALNRVTVNAGITTVVIGRRGATLISFNEHGHLEPRDRALLTYR